jgi:hypothetical protein
MCVRACVRLQTRLCYHVNKGNIFGSCLILVGVLTLFLLGKPPAGRHLSTL